MRVGVVTHWWCVENYGQILQCYAYQRFLKKRGHEPFIIRYNPFNVVGDRMTVKRVLRNLVNPILFIKKLYHRLSGRNKVAVERRRRVEVERRFADFKAQYISYTPSVFKTYTDLQKSNEIDADIYSVGSDVVWKLVPLNDDGRIFFLDFGRKLAKRIAYSPSFGAAELSENYKRFATPLIKKLDFVSVRERVGVKLCNEMGRDDVVHVMDPVFLLSGNEWRNEFSVPTQRDGVFGYFLSVKSGVPISAISTLEQDLSKIKITTVYSDMNVPVELQANPTIPEWIRYVGSSNMVITNSFHCASMAIIMHTPFMVCLKEGGNGMDSRLISVLNRLGLSSRIYSAENGTLKAQMENPIDWKSVDVLLFEQLTDSIDFLNRAGL